MPPKAPTVDPCIGCRDLENGPLCIGSDGCRDYHALAAAYLKLPAVGENARTIPHNYAFDCVFSMTTESAEDALAFVFVALEHARTAKQEAYLAAGALEHLLRRHGALVIDRVLGAARQDPKFRRCLAGVWGHSGMEKTVRERIDEILAPPKILQKPPRKNKRSKPR